ncbi:MULTISPECIES: hypothetical protein [unclassified Salinivibrio]|uniref:hypothetical protein n=1 Tax=unclassified Salinivibrio TaxID=2636825 RepID=UPI001883C68F|nr:MULTISPECIES: hypothetical protein [unclassified Salinivibrio]
MADTLSTNTHHESFEGIRREDEHCNDVAEHFVDVRKMVGIGRVFKLKETLHL